MPAAHAHSKNFKDGYVKGFTQGKKKEQEAMKRYIHSDTPKKQFVRRYIIRERPPGKVYTSEIVAGLFIILMLLMLLWNYLYVRSYVPPPKNQTAEQVVDVNVKIDGQAAEGPNLLEHSPMKAPNISSF